MRSPSPVPPSSAFGGGHEARVGNGSLPNIGAPVTLTTKRTGARYSAAEEQLFDGPTSTHSLLDSPVLTGSGPPSAGSPGAGVDGGDGGKVEHTYFLSKRPRSVTQERLNMTAPLEPSQARAGSPSPTPVKGSSGRGSSSGNMAAAAAAARASVASQGGSPARPQTVHSTVSPMMLDGTSPQANQGRRASLEPLGSDPPVIHGGVASPGGHHYPGIAPSDAQRPTGSPLMVAEQGSFTRARSDTPVFAGNSRRSVTGAGSLPPLDAASPGGSSAVGRSQIDNLQSQLDESVRLNDFVTKQADVLSRREKELSARNAVLERESETNKDRICKLEAELEAERDKTSSLQMQLDAVTKRNLGVVDMAGASLASELKRHDSVSSLRRQASQKIVDDGDAAGDPASESLSRKSSVASLRQIGSLAERPVPNERIIEMTEMLFPKLHFDRLHGSVKIGDQRMIMMRGKTLASEIVARWQKRHAMTDIDAAQSMCRAILFELCFAMGSSDGSFYYQRLPRVGDKRTRVEAALAAMCAAITVYGWGAMQAVERTSSSGDDEVIVLEFENAFEAELGGGAQVQNGCSMLAGFLAGWCHSVMGIDVDAKLVHYDEKTGVSRFLVGPKHILAGRRGMFETTLDGNSLDAFSRQKLLDEIEDLTRQRDHLMSSLEHKDSDMDELRDQLKAVLQPLIPKPLYDEYEARQSLSSSGLARLVVEQAAEADEEHKEELAKTVTKDLLVFKEYAAATAVAVELFGLVAMARHSSSPAVVGTLQRIWDGVSKLAEDAGLFVLRRGDTMTCVSGIGRAQDQHTKVALQFCRRVQQLCSKQQCPVRLAVHAGPMLLVIAPDKTTSLVGETSYVVRSAVQQASPDTVVVTDPAKDMLEAQGGGPASVKKLDAKRSIHIKGKTPMAVYEVGW